MLQMLNVEPNTLHRSCQQFLQAPNRLLINISIYLHRWASLPSFVIVINSSNLLSLRFLVKKSNSKTGSLFSFFWQEKIGSLEKPKKPPNKLSNQNLGINRTNEDKETFKEWSPIQWSPKSGFSPNHRFSMIQEWHWPLRDEFPKKTKNRTPPPPPPGRLLKTIFTYYKRMAKGTPFTMESP